MKARLRQPIVLPDRPLLIAAGLTLGLANSGFQYGVEFAGLHGLWAGLAGLFGISALIWVALPALWLVSGERDAGGAEARAVRATDIILLALLVLACLVPIRSAAAVATTVLALGVLLPERPGTPLFRAALIALSAVTALFWGRVMLDVTGTALLDLDVALAGTFGGLASEGNLLFFATSDPAYAGQGFMVASACSSLHGVSIALLGWALVTQFYNLPVSRRTVACGLAGVLGTIAVNVARISAMGHFPQGFEWLHVGPGAVIAGWVSMGIVLLANMGGNWGAITRSAHAG